MSTMVDGYEIIELPYVLVFDPVRHKIRCPYCLLDVPGIFAQGDIYRCSGCRVQWFRWCESFYGAVYMDDVEIVSVGLREIEKAYGELAGEIWRAA